METTDPRSPRIDRYDVVVVGGGAAGLSGALTLARARRTVLVLDAGEPRNAPAAGVHGYLGREGTPPAELMAIARAEVTAYGARVESASVREAAPWDHPGTGFRVVLDDGSEVEARRLLVATGLVDDLPGVPGLREHWGSGVLHCPYCHGWEVRDRAVVIVATSAMATHQALMWRQLTDRTTLVVDPILAPAPGAEERERLAARGVVVLEAAVSGVAGEPGDLRGLELADGRVVEADAIVATGRMTARLGGLEGLGLAAEPFEMAGTVFGALVPTGPMGATDVPGVWAAGNVTDLAAQVVVAAGQGLQAGVGINGDLIEEEVAAAVTAAREAGATPNGQPWAEQAWWDERYAGRGSHPVRVNPTLEAEVADLAPGRALDVGTGEGGDALWLAAGGWQVTATDFSPVALERGAARAASEEAAGRIEWRQVDARTFGPGAERWDLVTSFFLHLPGGGMADVVRRLADAVAPGGTLLVVGHHPDDLGTGLRDGHRDWMCTPEELATPLDPAQWKITATVRRRIESHAGRGSAEVADSVLRARRR